MHIRLFDTQLLVWTGFKYHVTTWLLLGSFANGCRLCLRSTYGEYRLRLFVSCSELLWKRYQSANRSDSKVIGWIPSLQIHLEVGWPSVMYEMKVESHSIGD